MDIKVGIIGTHCILKISSTVGQRHRLCGPPLAASHCFCLHPRTMTLLTDPVGDPLGNTIAAIDPLSCLLPSGVDGCGRRSEWKKFRHHGTRLKRLAKMQPNLRGPVNAKTLNPIA